MKNFNALVTAVTTILLAVTSTIIEYLATVDPNFTKAPLIILFIGIVSAFYSYTTSQ